jgi:serine phosphatase RsbU (regulator of sigma subunit)
VNGANRLHDFFDTYTKDLKAEDLQRLFTRDTREAYKFFTRGTDIDSFKNLPWYKRLAMHTKVLFFAFTLKLSPARRIVYAAALVFAFIGLVNLFRGIGIVQIMTLPFGVGVGLPGPLFTQGTWSLFIAFGLMNLLVLLEVADRLSLKNDLEIAREIQQAMLPGRVQRGLDRDDRHQPPGQHGRRRLHDILPLPDGRVVVTVGDVAGKGSPAALLMALLLAMLRTLVDEGLEPAALVTRLNVQVARHAPGTRFITLLYAVFDPRTGELTYVNAGHMPPMLMRSDGTSARLTEGGIALGMFDHSTYTTGQVTIQCEDIVAIYSDGITEAEDPSGRPFDEAGLESALVAHRHDSLSAMGAAVVRAVEQYTADTRLADDLTILLLRRCTTPTPVGV